MQRYRKIGEKRFFGEYFRLAKLSKHGDPLERLNQVVDWQIFMPILEKLENKERKGNAGAKSYPLILMFKILILQRYYNLSDKQIEYQILDRLSFCRFLDLSLEDKVPDEKIVWDFRERLINQNLDIELFDIFKFKLEENDLLAHEGKIILK